MPAAALAYPALVGPVAEGDAVLLNTTAVTLGLGSGGAHFVVAVLGRESDGRGPGPGPRDEAPVHAPPGGHAGRRGAPTAPPPAMAAAEGLDGTPVVWLPLHSMLGPAAAGARAAGAARVAYVMTDGAALPRPSPAWRIPCARRGSWTRSSRRVRRSAATWRA